MPRKKKSAEEESAASSKPTAKKSAAVQPEEKPVKRARAKKAKSSEETAPDPLLAAQTERTVESPASEVTQAPDAELNAHAADAFEEAFDEKSGAAPHVLDSKMIDAVAASGVEEAAEEDEDEILDEDEDLDEED